MTVRIGRALPPPSGRAPEMNLAPRDVAGLDETLTGYHQLFADCFVRREQRHWALKYSQGQLLDLPRKSIEPMAVALVDGNIQAMQQFISQGAWSDDEVVAIRRRDVADRKTALCPERLAALAALLHGEAVVEPAAA